VRGLTGQWEQQWHRQPTPTEVDGLIRDYIKDEVYYREALRLGLDKDDVIMRRRMRSKMEFLVAAQAENETPSDAALQRWLDTHPRDYATAPALSFDQIYVGSDAEAARRALAQLDKGVNPATLAQSMSVPPTLDAALAGDIDRQFGDGFARAVAALPPGRWAGPVTSGFGQHLVRLRKLTPGAVPPLSAVRKAVENDWREANRVARENAAYQALLDGYTIRIAKP
jgi:peptidyl-prolyl cis-trans isomerase C